MESTEENYCTLYLVRHGETERNKNDIVMGQQDSPLTENGVRQIEARANELRNIHFDAAFSSDLPRAERSAEIMITERQLAIQTSKLLRERSYGHFEGGPSKEYRDMVRHLMEQVKQLPEAEQWKFKFADDVESDEELINRFLVQLREIAVAYAGKTVLIVTHGGCIRMFLTRTGYAARAEVPSGSFENAGYVRAMSDGVNFFVKEVKGLKNNPHGSE